MRLEVIRGPGKLIWLTSQYSQHDTNFSSFKLRWIFVPISVEFFVLIFFYVTSENLVYKKIIDIPNQGAYKNNSRFQQKNIHLRFILQFKVVSRVSGNIWEIQPVLNLKAVFEGLSIYPICSIDIIHSIEVAAGVGSRYNVIVLYLYSSNLQRIEHP